MGRGIPSKSVLLVILMASDALGAEFLVDAVILPKWVAVEKNIREWLGKVYKYCRAIVVYYLVLGVAWYQQVIFERQKIRVIKAQ